MANNPTIQKGKFIEITLTEWANEGKALARVPTEGGDKVIFVPNGIPGQKVKARVTRNRNSFAEAKLIEVLEASPQEINQPFQPIPGAPYASLPLALQQKHKQESALQLLKRIGKVAQPENLLDEFITSPHHWHYRNKMEYSFSAVAALPNEERFIDTFALGFKKRGQWLAVEPLLQDSGLFDEQWENAMPRLAEFFTARQHTAWHSKLGKGFCRLLAVRKSFAHNKLLVNFTSSSSELSFFDSKAFTKLVQDILGERLGGLIHTINDDVSDRPDANAGEQRLLAGEHYIMENICGLQFKISPQSFFQTNPAAAEKLYSKALGYAEEHTTGEKPLVLDLFSGTGTLTQLLAQRLPHKKIVGVEIVPEAVQDALKNAALNNLEGEVQFFTGDVGHFLLENPEYQQQIDTVLLDPPRAGVTPKTLRKIMRLEADRIVYISCNPATQARDILALAEFGYQIQKFSLVDQFPHTAHLESIALFHKKDT